jgi:hypothetical protein
MNAIPTNAEVTFWVILLVIAVALFIALPIINRVMEYKSNQEKYGYTEYHDDMEDVWD